VNFDELKNEALKLSLEHRAELARELLQNLDPAQDNVSEEQYERLWLEEVERRIAAVDRGEMKTYSREEVFARLKAAREAHTLKRLETKVE
jgi:putative addiction module component (TIGR02574 family)